MTVLRRPLALGALLFVVAPALVAQSNAPRDPRVDAIVQAVIKSNEPGGSIVVIRDGKVVHVAGYGLADLDSRKPNLPGTRYHMASTGKQFTALSLMMLHQDGRLDYDDPVGKHLPEVARFGDSLTIRQVLHHTSGIPDYYDDSTGYKLLLASSPMPTNDDALALLHRWGTPKPAGREFVYSNSGYDLLGTLVEHLSGKSLDGFLQQRVFGPTGMTGCFSMPNAKRFAEPERARGYDKTEKKFTADDQDPLDNLVGSGSVYCSVEDLARYDAALYTDQLVRQTTLADAFEPGRLVDGKSVDYGFAWGIADRNGYHYEGHSGSWEGYLSYILRCRSQHFSIYFLQNRTDIKPRDVVMKVFDLYLPAPTGVTAGSGPN
jgi:CubicO group peptidase (beta-lactamase class C family)